MKDTIIQSQRENVQVEHFCLCCKLHPVRQYAIAGLCVSCKWDVLHCELAPVVRADGSVYLAYLSTSVHVLTGEPDTIYPPIPWNPRDALPHDATPAEIGELTAELLTLGVQRPYLTLRREAVYIIDAIRRAGSRVGIDVQLGFADIENPRRVPYPVLVRFLELREHVEDELTLERAKNIEDARAAYDLVASRFGHEYAGREYPGGSDDASDREEIHGTENLCPL